MSEPGRIEENVSKYGWHATAVVADENSPGFVYTTGLGATFSHPEAILFGLDASVSYGLLSALVTDLRSGKNYAAPGEYPDLLTVPVAVRRVHSSQHQMYFADALGFYRESGTPFGFTAIQLFWPDREGRFPFEADCDPMVSQAQPRLDVPLPPSELAAFQREYS